MILRHVIATTLAFLSLEFSHAAESTPPSSGSFPFDVKLGAGFVSSLKAAKDPHHTEYIAPGGRLGGISIRFRNPGGGWQTVNTADLEGASVIDAKSERPSCRVIYQINDGAATALHIRIGLAIQADSLEWTINLKNGTMETLEVADLSLPLPMNSSFRQGAPAVLKHSFISGHGSFLYWLRPDSAEPYLTLIPAGDTHFEYWEAQPDYRVFIHSAAAGALASERGTRWRQPNTSLTLAAAGQPGDSRDYGCKFRWAAGHEDVRKILFEDGGIDVQVVPGMTVPTDLSARFALRTKWDIRSVDAEFPESTRITPVGSRNGYQIYQASFDKLGENRLTVRYGDGRHVFLEFFATEPLEILIRKRAAFITRCQHRDPGKWYDGLFSEWNMETGVLLGPDNYDRIKGWRIYEVSCDDPGLSKPAFLAAKNSRYPVANEVAAMDRYLEHFVWGGLQRTSAETHPYGIYGIPDWKTNRESADQGSKGKLHLWRPYDYPHVVLMYFSMYQVARDHPQIKTVLSADEYLQRAFGTALAMFTVPMEIAKWSAYETGFYNEMVIVDLIRELELVGMKAEAEQLQEHWTRKIRHFVNSKPNLFQSEYPFDSTGFESTHAIAKEALLRAEFGAAPPDGITPGNARRFMETQIAANIFCRGSIEPAYYYLGSDYRSGAGNSYTLSYMSQMGGWAVLDYALNHASDPVSSLRLGYASFLSAWALMNTGTATSNYGYWYPGAANDGAAGGGFEPAPFGTTWLGQPHHRGAWYYACETDLGYCAALRTAATVLTDDPIFGRFCFGGRERTVAGRIEVVPMDGVCQRFHALIGATRLHVVLDRDRFAAARPVTVQGDFSGLDFLLESDNPAPHPVRMRLSGLRPGWYSVGADPQRRVTLRIDQDRETAVTVPAVTSGQHISIRPEDHVRE
jgi:hypothetical protein